MILSPYDLLISHRPIKMLLVNALWSVPVRFDGMSLIGIVNFGRLVRCLNVISCLNTKLKEYNITNIKTKIVSENITVKYRHSISYGKTPKELKRLEFEFRISWCRVVKKTPEEIQRDQLAERKARFLLDLRFVIKKW